MSRSIPGSITWYPGKSNDLVPTYSGKSSDQVLGYPGKSSDCVLGYSGKSSDLIPGYPQKSSDPVPRYLGNSSDWVIGYLRVAHFAESNFFYFKPTSSIVYIRHLRQKNNYLRPVGAFPERH